MEVKLLPTTHSPGRIPEVDPPWGSRIYAIGVLEPRTGGSTFWTLLGAWVTFSRCRNFTDQRYFMDHVGMRSLPAFKKLQHMNLAQHLLPEPKIGGCAVPNCTQLSAAGGLSGGRSWDCERKSRRSASCGLKQSRSNYTNQSMRSQILDLLPSYLGTSTFRRTNNGSCHEPECW